MKKIQPTLKRFVALFAVLLIALPIITSLYQPKALALSQEIDASAFGTLKYKAGDSSGVSAEFTPVGGSVLQMVSASRENPEVALEVQNSSPGYVTSDDQTQPNKVLKLGSMECTKLEAYPINTSLPTSEFKSKLATARAGASDSTPVAFLLNSLIDGIAGDNVMSYKLGSQFLILSCQNANAGNLNENYTFFNIDAPGTAGTGGGGATTTTCSDGSVVISPATCPNGDSGTPSAPLNNGVDWVDSQGRVAKNDAIVTRFSYKSPWIINDSTTATNYIADLPLQTHSGDRYVADSVIWYRPRASDGTIINTNLAATACLGMFAVRISDGAPNNDWSDSAGNGQVYAVPAKIQTTKKCTVGDQPTDPLSGDLNKDAGFNGFLQTHDGDWRISKALSDKDDDSRLVNFYAPFLWKSKDELVSLSGNSIKKLDETDQKVITMRTILQQEGTPIDDSDIWSSGACSATGSGRFSFIAIKKTTSDTQMKDASGKVYSAGDRNGFDWNGGDLKCLLGEKVDHNPDSGNSSILKHNYEGGIEYIAFPELTDSDTSNDGVAGTQAAAVQSLEAGADGTGIPNCEDSIQDGFGWLLCPILHWADDFISKAESEIKDQLTVSNTSFTDPGLKKSWTVVARVSSAILVLIALVMVISTAMGFGVFDAYTVKKVLPRLVIAAIGIWLSWLLVTTYISIMNDVGKGIADLMFSPFGGAQTPAVTYNQVDLSYLFGLASSGSGTFAGFAITGTVIVALLASGGVFALLGALVPLAAFIAIGFIVLTIRQAVIVFLLVLAPLGIVMWILPGTQKLWKHWSGTLNKLLIMFPMFMGLFAAAKIFALISAQASAARALANHTTPGLFDILIPIVAYVSPFIFLPALFKAAGGLFSNLTGMVNNKSKGIFDKAKGGLDARAKSSKAFKDQMGQEKLARSAAGQGRFGAGGAVLSKARMRAKGGQPIFAGALSVGNRAATKSRVDSTMGAALKKLEDQQVEEAGVAIERDVALFNNDKKPGATKGALQLMIEDPKSSQAQVRAALARLAQMRQVEALGDARQFLHSHGKGDTWDKFATAKSGDFREFAPHLAGTGATPRPDWSDGASAESAAKWNQATWEAAFAANPTNTARLARDVLDNDRLSQSLGGTWSGKTGNDDAEFKDGKFKYNGTADYLNRFASPASASSSGGGGTSTPGTVVTPTPPTSGTAPWTPTPPPVPPPAGPAPTTTPTSPPPAGPAPTTTPTSPPPAGPAPTPPPPPPGPWVPPTT